MIHVYFSKYAELPPKNVKSVTAILISVSLHPFSCKFRAKLVKKSEIKVQKCSLF